MSRHERPYQKYLEHKRQKRGRGSDTARLAGQMATLAHHPLHEALVSKKLFEVGIGHLVISGTLPDGRIALGPAGASPVFWSLRLGDWAIYIRS